MMKRIIALLLALILTVGLLPTVALATEGDTPVAGTSSDVKNGYYEGTTWKEGTLNQGTLPTGVESVSKTAKKVEGEENKYEVTLKVVLQQTEENSGKAATVLVLDTSVSMAYCAECGVEGDCVHNYVKFNGTPNSNDQYYYKTTDKNGKEKFEYAYYCDGNHTNNKHNAGWFKSNKDRKHTAPNRLRDDNIYFKTTRASRLDAAKVAAENFLKTYSGLTFNTDGTVAANQNSRNLGRYVSVVSFAKKAKSVQSWVDVSNSDVYQKVLKNIKGLSAEGGTNLDAGLTYAEYLLNDNTVRGAVKNVIALTDGQPTYCLKKNCNDLLHLLRTKLTIGSTKYCVHGDGTECTDEIYNSTVDTATRVKNVPSKLYTVCFDAGETIDVPNNGGQISVSEYLSTKIATQPTKTGEQFAYDADNAEKLYVEFAKITQSIVSGLNNGTVKDTLPAGITSEAFGKDKVKEWKLNEAPFTKNETPNTVGEKQVTTYTYTYAYTVTIAPEKASLVEVGGENYAPLNGETTLTVGSGADAKEIPFPIPAGKVTMPSHTVTYTDGVDSEVVFENVEKTAAYKAAIPAYGDSNPTRTGYTFTSWKWYNATDTTYANEITPAPTTMPAYNLVAVAQWTPATDTKYIVEHYLQNLTGDGYTLDETETKAGTTGAQTEAVAKSYPGFTVQSFNQQTIAADGTTVVEIHYNRNTYKVTYDYGTAPDGASDLPTEATYKYGAKVPVADKATAPGYNFDGWKKDGTVTASFEMPAQNVTLTGSWTLKAPTAVIVNLNNHIYKTFTSDTADIPNGKLTFNVTVSGKSDNAASMTRSGYVEFTRQDVQDGTTSKAFAFASDPLTFTAAGEYTFEVVEDTTTTINGLTYNVGNGTHTFTIVVDKKANTNELEVKEVRVGTAEYTGNALTATLAYATITNNYVEPKKTFDLNNTIFKTFTPVAGGLPIPTGEGISYTFTARMTEQTEEGFAVGDTGRNYTLKATLTGEVIEANKVPFTVEGASEVSFAPGMYYFLVQEDSTAAVTGTVNGTIHNDSQAYLLTLTVKEDQGKLDFETDVKPATVVMSLEEPTPGLGTVTFNNTYEEKEPGKYTINFSDLIVKCLTKEGSKAFTGAEFTANVTGWKYMEKEAKPWAMLANATSFAFTDLPSRTLTATFPADAVFNSDNDAYRPFTGDTLTVEEGDYLFLIEENNGGQSNITYDEAKYWLAVRVRFENDEPIVAVYRRTYTAGDSYNTVFENETKWSDPIPANITPVTFYNTIDTGKDDYYPIIIPTIINKDTGMLNKTDHFAYVIGYPDGTVHPNGQITRAEVATIFFRLLRDEVRDGAFTTSNSYSDVAYGKWYNNPISTMSALGIITGYPDGTFKPNKPITRAEFAAIAARFDETQSGKSATFSDVIGHWAAKEIGIAYYNDWIKGYPDGTFKPDQNITRAEAMTLINRVLERKPETPADLLTNMNKWTDNMDTSKWYYLDVQEATNSHGYTRKTFNYELWRQMLPDPDWSRYER